MSLVRWLRKNNSKIMAVVVIVIMFGFVGGSYLSYLGRKRSPLNEAVAFYLDDIKITRNDLSTAQMELELLRTVAANELLRAQDIEGIALAELLFTEDQKNIDLVRYTKGIITRQEYRIPGGHIGNIYEPSMPPAYYWVLLKAEAGKAGVRVSNTEAFQLLNQAIPVLTRGAVTYPRAVYELSKRGHQEDTILRATANLLEVLQYCRYVCSDEDLTVSEMALEAAYNMETVDANLVKFEAEAFTKDVAEPTEEELVAHFEKHKEFLPGHITEDYPYGFGYKLSDRVQLEYMAIKLGDVKKAIPAPSPEETEAYYQGHQSNFAKQAPSDPNDPNSSPKEEITPYAEVAQMIADELLDKKIYARCDAILQEAILMSELNIHGEGLIPAELTSAQWKKYARDYGELAELLSQNHGIKVYSGKTGMLGPEDISADRYLGTMIVEGYGYFTVPIGRVAFAVDELKLSELGPFDSPQKKMYANIGPVKDPWASFFSRIDDPVRQVCAIMRVAKVEKSRVPESIDESYETHSLIFDPNNESDKSVHSIREAVTKDVKKLKAMEVAKAKAVEFIKLAKAEGWDTAIKKFNELYPGESAEDEDTDPNNFSVEALTGSRRNTLARMIALSAINKGLPNARLMNLAVELETMFTERLYEMVPAESAGITEPNEPVEFKPAASYFCIKDLSINRLWKEGFESNKPLVADRLDKIESQTLSVVHFDPQNISERMRFRWAEDSAGAADANTPDVNAMADDAVDANASIEDSADTNTPEPVEDQ